ncbi:MAG: CAP domain-containing protein [bacterium]
MISFLAHFLPHKENRKRAKLLSHPALLSYVVFIFGAILITNFASMRFPQVLGFASNISTEDLLNYTNETRAENNEKPLKLNSLLSQAAYEKAQDMFSKDYWAHVSPTGKEPWDFIVATNYEYIYAGENLARDFNNSNSVVQAWLKSPSHRDNLLSSNYEDIGFAVVNGVLDGHETTLVVQMFGKSRFPEYTASIEPLPEKIEEEPVASKVSEIPEIAKVPKTSEVFEVSSKPEVIANPLFGGLKEEKVGEILPAVDVFNMSRGISLSLGAFLTLLFALDVWYIKRNSILRVSGNTFAHLLFLILALIGVWYANAGIIL